MGFETQSTKLLVANFDNFTKEWKREVKWDGNLVTNNVRAIFCGPSNYGKTNALLSLITHPSGLKFENVYVYSKSLEQPKYKFLKFLLEPINGIQYFPFKDHDKVISVEDA